MNPSFDCNFFLPCIIILTNLKHIIKINHVIQRLPKDD
jgi:hypothetical protein